MNKCQYCNQDKPNKNSLSNHQRYCKDNPNRVSHPCEKYHANGGNKNKIPWNKGLTKETDPRILDMTQKMIEGYESGRLIPHCSPHTEESKKKLSEIAKERKLGGYVKGSGRGKKGWYKDFFCDSSWELAYVIYCLEHNIEIVRNKVPREYIWQGKVFKYYPDFIVNGEIIEIKSFWSAKTQAKIDYNPDVKFLWKEDMIPILEYVTQKYGKDFVKLYGGTSRWRETALKAAPV